MAKVPQGKNPEENPLGKNLWEKPNKKTKQFHTDIYYTHRQTPLPAICLVQHFLEHLITSEVPNGRKILGRRKTNGEGGGRCRKIRAHAHLRHVAAINTYNQPRAPMRTHATSHLLPGAYFLPRSNASSVGGVWRARLACCCVPDPPPIYGYS